MCQCADPTNAIHAKRITLASLTGPSITICIPEKLFIQCNCKRADFISKLNGLRLQLLLGW